MRKVLKTIATWMMACIGLGFIVSKVEKKKGWVEERRPYGFYEKEVKRPLDFGLSLFAMIFLWPVFLAVSLLIKRNIGSPVIFTQRRPGLGEKIFTLRKYRTMTDEKDAEGKMLPDRQRLTKFGKKMRATSLDELPEIINILKGDMAIVGPRPQLIQDMVFMSKEERRRHDIRPGLTGLAQVSGRNGITWKSKLEMDLKYCEKITFLGDLSIVLQTVKKVILKDGITEDGQATAQDYGDWLLVHGQIDRAEYEEKLREAERILYEVT